MSVKSSEWTVDTLKEYLLDKIDNNDKRYEQRFNAQEKAVLKSEEAQRETNAKSNEFRASLDDSNKTKQDRKEAEIRIASIDNKIDTQRQAFEREMDEMRKEINGLRESRSMGTGEKQAWGNAIAQRNFTISLIVGVVMGVIGFVVAYVMK